MKPTPLELAAAQCVAELSMLKFFPGDELARAALMRALVEMANNPGELRDLSRRVLAHYDEWPGPREIRAVFCTFAKPRDGVEAGVTGAGTLSAAIEQRALEAHSEVKHLAAGESVVKQLSEAKRL